MVICYFFSGHYFKLARRWITVIIQRVLFRFVGHLVNIQCWLNFGIPALTDFHQSQGIGAALVTRRIQRSDGTFLKFDCC